MANNTEWCNGKITRHLVQEEYLLVSCNQCDKIGRCQRPNFLAALGRRVKDSEYSRADQERSLNDEQVLISSLFYISVTKILQYQ